MRVSGGTSTERSSVECRTDAGRGAWGGGHPPPPPILTHSAPPGPQVGPGLLGGRCAWAPPEHVPGLSWVPQAPTPCHARPRRGAQTCARGYGGWDMGGDARGGRGTARPTRRGLRDEDRGHARTFLNRKEKKTFCTSDDARQRWLAGGSLREKQKKKKSVPVHSFPKKTACSSYVQPWLVAVGGWQLATGGWWWLVVVGGGWRRLVVGGGWPLVVPWGGP